LHRSSGTVYLRGPSSEIEGGQGTPEANLRGASKK